MKGATRSPDSLTQSTEQDREAFAGTLMGLKRRGCCVLVTGQVDEEVRATQSRHLFGHSDEHRQRVLLLTDATPSLTSQYLPGDITAAHSTVSKLDYTDEARDIACSTSSSFNLSSVDPIKEPTSVAGIGALLCDPISNVIQADTLDPGELRLGIATLTILLDTDGLSATQAFLRKIRQQMLAAHGMAHFHLTSSIDAETFTALRPMIDIHIELRKPNSIPEHRWHLLETGHSTDWRPMRP